MLQFYSGAVSLTCPSLILLLSFHLLFLQILCCNSFAEAVLQKGRVGKGKAVKIYAIQDSLYVHKNLGKKAGLV